MNQEKIDTLLSPGVKIVTVTEFETLLYEPLKNLKEITEEYVRPILKRWGEEVCNNTPDVEVAVQSGNDVIFIVPPIITAYDIEETKIKIDDTSYDHKPKIEYDDSFNPENGIIDKVLNSYQTPGDLKIKQLSEDKDSGDIAYKTSVSSEL